MVADISTIMELDNENSVMITESDIRIVVKDPNVTVSKASTKTVDNTGESEELMRVAEDCWQNLNLKQLIFPIMWFSVAR